MLPVLKAEVSRRIRINEDCRLYRYRDSVRDDDHPVGVITLAWGWNDERADSQTAYAKVGIDFTRVRVSPIAVDADPANAVAACITQAQADALFDDVALPPVLIQAHNSLEHLGAPPNVFDRLSDARQYVVVDMPYNMGEDEWLAFVGTRTLIVQAQMQKDAGNMQRAHDLFMQAAHHMEVSDWYGQTGDRAKRNVAMMRTGVFVDANGDGT
jgi:hypothetical protein